MAPFETMSRLTVPACHEILVVEFDSFDDVHELYFRTTKRELQFNPNQKLAVANSFREMVSQKSV
ncbi:hypothetical protein N9189_01095 [Pirellulaceae bacterium]|jgi:hypothetical protein|nr:hypothetical protein [Pirellulaceae bacterium]